MDAVVVYSSAQDVQEFLIGVASGRHSGFIRREIARVEMGEAGDWTEVASATEIGGRVDLLLAAIWRLEQVGVSCWHILRLWAGAVATIAVGVRVHDVASQSDELGIFAVHVEMNWGDLE